MTRADALKIWLPVIKMGVESMQECSEALDMAIKALQQEPCTDAISRKAAIDALTKTSGIRGDALKALYDLPPITTAEKVGHWIKTIGENGVTSAVRCSECGFEDNRYMMFRYCPYCGAKMQEVSKMRLIDADRLKADNPRYMNLDVPYFSEETVEDKCKNCKYSRNPDYTRCHDCKAESEVQDAGCD